MATQTTHYNLTKPDLTDLVDVTVLNGNADIIDQKIYEASQSGGSSAMIETSVETSATSAHAYAAGDHFIYNGTLYRATAAIAIGDTITPESNCVATTAAAELEGKVDKVSGKQLSTEDYTTAEKTKLAGIEAQANKTVIDSTLTQTGQAADAKAAGDAVSELRNTLNHKADLIYDTASGDIASFPDGADGLPVKDLTVAIEPVQSGTGDPSPTNVRPISGWTGCNVTRTGKNLAKPYQYTAETGNVTFVYDGNGGITLNGTATASNAVPTVSAAISNGFTFPLAAGTYIPSLSDTGAYVEVYDSDTTTRLSNGNAFTISNETNVLIRVSENIGTVYDNKKYYIQLELGTTPSAYEPYIGTVIPISWQSEAGTVYGGSDEIVSGALTSTMGMVDLGTLTWGKSGDRMYAQLESQSITGWTFNLLSSQYVTSVYINQSTPPVDCIMGRNNNNIFIYDSAYTDPAAFKAAMSGVQLCYELATHQTYQLTPAEVITTLLGQNNVWADCGPVSVEYPADTKLYIQKINTPTDDDMIADAQIASGKYFIVNNNLYLSTAAILAGDPIKPGTNCTLTNLAAALNALNS